MHSCFNISFRHIHMLMYPLTYSFLYFNTFFPSRFRSTSKMFATHKDTNFRVVPFNSTFDSLATGHLLTFRLSGFTHLAGTVAGRFDYIRNFTYLSKAFGPNNEHVSFTRLPWGCQKQGSEYWSKTLDLRH